MNTPSGNTDFTGIVNSVQMLTQIVGQAGKAFAPVIASDSGAPIPGPGNALDMIRVNAAGTAYEIRTPAQVASDLNQLPPTAGIALDMIRVNAGGTAYEARTPAQVVTDLALNNTVPVGASNSTTGTTISVTTPSFTAPCSGALVIIGRGGSPSPAGSSSLSTSLAGAVVVFQVAAAVSRAFGYLPMNASQSTTATFQFSVLTSQALVATVAAFFLPKA